MAKSSDPVIHAKKVLDTLIAKYDPQAVAESHPGKNPRAVASGIIGGTKGGPARAKKLTPERRSEIATKAAKARWRKK
jgi:hypothetical protein